MKINHDKILCACYFVTAGLMIGLLIFTDGGIAPVAAVILGVNLIFGVKELSKL